MPLSETKNSKSEAPYHADLPAERFITFNQGVLLRIGPFVRPLGAQKLVKISNLPSKRSGFRQKDGWPAIETCKGFLEIGLYILDLQFLQVYGVQAILYYTWLSEALASVTLQLIFESMMPSLQAALVAFDATHPCRKRQRNQRELPVIQSEQPLYAPPGHRRAGWQPLRSPCAQSCGTGPQERTLQHPREDPPRGTALKVTKCSEFRACAIPAMVKIRYH